MNRGPVVLALGLVVGVGLAAIVSTCAGQGGTDRTFAPSSTLDEQCGDSPENAGRVVAQAADGFELGGSVVAPRDTDSIGSVVVLRHGASHTLCDWLGWASATSDASGATFVLMDRRGQGSSPGRADLSRDPSDVVQMLASAGFSSDTRELVLLGSSMGNASTLSTLPLLTRVPCALVAISPVPASGPLDGVAVLRGASVAPASTHLVWARDDANVAVNATAVADAARAVESRVSELVVDGDAHARAVLDAHADADAFVREALLDCG